MVQRVLKSPVVAAFVAAGITFALATGIQVASASPHAAVKPQSAGAPKAYIARLTGAHTNLTSTPVLVLQTGALAAGTYAVQAQAGVVLGAGDHVVCATTPDSLGFENNDGIFGGQGNGGVSVSNYSNAVIVDQWTVGKGDKIDLTCNSGLDDASYVGNAAISLIKVTPAG